jgi:hypothetical protein
LPTLDHDPVPPEPEPECQAEQLEIRLEPRPAVGHGQLGEYDERQDEPE